MKNIRHKVSIINLYGNIPLPIMGTLNVLTADVAVVRFTFLDRLRYITKSFIH